MALPWYTQASTAAHMWAGSNGLISWPCRPPSDVRTSSLDPNTDDGQTASLRQLSMDPFNSAAPSLALTHPTTGARPTMRTSSPRLATQRELRRHTGCMLWTTMPMLHTLAQRLNHRTAHDLWPADGCHQPQPLGQRLCVLLPIPPTTPSKPADVPSAHTHMHCSSVVLLAHVLF
jgi:hypothetical protein